MQNSSFRRHEFGSCFQRFFDVRPVLCKGSLNVGVEPELTFWRDKTGNEVDLLRRDVNRQIAYEIKSGATFSPDYFANLGLWARLSGATPEQCNVVYGGDKSLKTSHGEVIAWNKQ